MSFAPWHTLPIRLYVCIFEGMWWEYMGCGAMHSIDYGVVPSSSSSGLCPLLPDCNGVHHPNLFFRCLSAAAATGLKNAFVIVQISRFQQIIGVFTLQAPTEALKVSTFSRSGGCCQGQIALKVKLCSYLNGSKGHDADQARKASRFQGQCSQG